MTGRRVVITGAQGLLGRRLVNSFLAAGDEVLGVGRSPESNVSYTHDLEWNGTRQVAPLGDWARPTSGSYRYEIVDLCEAAKSNVLADFAAEIVIHSAAALRDEPWATLQTSNVDTLFEMFDSFAASAPLVVLVSSGSVYGVTAESDLPHDEAHPRNPGDLYAVTKSGAEDVARILGAERGIPVVAARVFNLLGPGLQDRHLAGSLAGQMAAITLGLAPARLRLGDLVTTRDFIDVRDAADAILSLVEAETVTYTGHAVNIASGIETPVQRIFDELLAIAKLDQTLEIERLPGRPIDLPRSFAAVERLGATGFRPRHRLTSSLTDMFNYYLDWAAST